MGMYFKRKTRDKDLALNNRAIRGMRTQCEREKIDSLFEGIDYSCSLPCARVEEPNLDYVRKSMGFSRLFA